ncbi:MAG: HD domain-containing protein [Gammaproteobacteria bacterium]|nr:MAG: HD domain-containing protein [Gammaproteobacteria bacterium]
MTIHSALLDLLNAGDRLIMDPVHGGIPLFSHEVRIIDHPWFQRLRFICQNDILSYVFPGATHSRFLHSIGTAHVGGRLWLGLVETSLIRAQQAGIDYDAAAVMEATASLYRLVRLACLLHDCGHSSFSHQFERTPTLHAWLNEPDLHQALQQRCPELKLSDRQPVAHEHYSALIAAEILDATHFRDSTLSAGDVLSLMDATDGRPGPGMLAAMKEIWPVLTCDPDSPPDIQGLLTLLRSLVSGEMDADRADYLMRDSFHASVTLGGFNLDHLAKNLYVGWDPDSRWLGIAVSRKGLGALEDFVYSRYQMYRKVYGHKTSIGFDWLLRQAIEEVLRNTPCGEEVRNALEHPESYCQLTDNYFWEAFRRYGQLHPDSYSAMMTRRQRLKHVLTLQNGGTEHRDVKADLARKHGVSPTRIIHCSLPIRFTRINADYTGIRYAQRNSLKSGARPSYVPLVQASDFFSKFEDRMLTHFYVLPDEAPPPAV